MRRAAVCNTAALLYEDFFQIAMHNDRPHGDYFRFIIWHRGNRIEKIERVMVIALLNMSAVYVILPVILSSYGTVAK
ncbi:MAG: hypothetical protein AAB932_04745 [Patescibacteria group bacterium]